MKEVMRSIGLEDCSEMDLQGCQHVQHLRASCSPSIKFDAEPDFLGFWGGGGASDHKKMSPGGGGHPHVGRVTGLNLPPPAVIPTQLSFGLHRVHLSIFFPSLEFNITLLSSQVRLK